MKIAIVGHGYVGLVTACVFANFGNDVWVIGHTPEKIKRLKSGKPIISEPGLEELLKKNLEAGRIHFTLSFKEAVPSAEVVFICVGTPPKKTGEADLSAVLSVAESIGKNLGSAYTVVSCKSTVPVGTNDKVASVIKKMTHGSANFDIASCPEFLREGTALQDTLHPNRIVIGSNSQQAVQKLLELHKPISGERVITNLASAELIKYASNAMLATKLSFTNMIALLCEKVGADVEEVLNAVGMDKRIGRSFMQPGPGYGGSCLPKDVKALVHIGMNNGVNMSLLKAVDNVNIHVRKNIIKKILANNNIKHIAVWGLAFKANTDDIRETPSLYIINELLKKGYKITAYDPEAMDNVKQILGSSIYYAQNSYSAADNADLLLILTEWDEFKQIDLKKIYKKMNNPIIIDTRNLYEPKTVQSLGFIYRSIGRN